MLAIQLTVKKVISDIERLTLKVCFRDVATYMSSF